MTFKYNWNSCYICHCFSFNNRKQNYKILIYCSLFLPWLVSWGVASCACHPSCPSGKSGRLNHDSFHTWKFLKTGQESEFAYHSSVTHWTASYLRKLTEGKEEWENGERHEISIIFSWLARTLIHSAALFLSEIRHCLHFTVLYDAGFWEVSAYQSSLLPNRVVQFLQRLSIFIKMEVYCHAGIRVMSRGKVCHWASWYSEGPQYWKRNIGLLEKNCEWQLLPT